MALVLTDLSNELLLQILQHLPLRDVLSLSVLCRKLCGAVNLHLRLCQALDLCEGSVHGYTPSSLNDEHLHALLRKCPHLKILYGLHPAKVERRRLRRRSTLTAPGVINALSLCEELEAVATCNVRILEAILQHMPSITILGKFQNRDKTGQSPQRLRLQPLPCISSLHLVDIEIGEMPPIPLLEHIILERVHFTRLHPFGTFSAPALKTFVMRHCVGPSMSLRYLPLVIALATARDLSRLELVGVPLPSGLLQRSVEDSYRSGGYSNLRTLVLSGCKGVLEPDIGHVLVVSSGSLERVRLQPSLTRDGLFFSLAFAHCSFPHLTSLHLGYIDPGTPDDTARQDDNDTPALLTDSGMRALNRLFPDLKSLSIANCPHLVHPDQWYSLVEPPWPRLEDLCLQRCHCLQIPPFADFTARLPSLEVLVLHDMFREPPKGCSHVGLSAGTGLGMSSAVVSNQEEHLAVAGGPQDFEEEEDGAEEGEQREQHIVVLQQEFFDEEHNQEHLLEAPVLSPRNQDEKFPSSAEESDYDGLESLDDQKPSDHSGMRNHELYRSSNRNSSCSPSIDCSVTEKSCKVDSCAAPNCDRRNMQCAGPQNFDPNQPSTSKAGNCSSCACTNQADGDHNYYTHMASLQNQNISTNCKRAGDIEVDEGKTNKKRKKELNQSTAYDGPVTRHRSKALDIASNAEASSCLSKEANSSQQGHWDTTVNGAEGAKYKQHQCLYHRCAKRKANFEDYTFVSQGTQANSQDIRRALRKHRTCATARMRQHSCPHADPVRRPNRNPISTRQYSKKSKPKKTENLHHKSTSTSDPLMEDDAVQILHISSKTLLSLSVVSCGISDLHIERCFELTHVEVIGCRIFKKLSIENSIKVNRVGVSQCPKLMLTTLLDSICHLSPILCTYEPCSSQLNTAEIERCVFSKTSANHHIVLCFDYGSPSEGIPLQENLRDWSHSLISIHSSLKSKSLQKTKRNFRTGHALYPYGHYIRKIHGTSDEDDAHQIYQIVTNDFLLTSVLENISWDKGFPAPPLMDMRNLFSLMLDSCPSRSVKEKRHMAFYVSCV